MEPMILMPCMIRGVVGFPCIWAKSDEKLGFGGFRVKQNMLILLRMNL